MSAPSDSSSSAPLAGGQPDVAADVDAELDTDSPLRREFTPAERAAQLAAQIEEESIIAREMAALKEEQKTVFAAIKGRRVGFQTANAEQQTESSASSMALSNDDTFLEYTYHDNRLTRVLFVESACDSLAPLACALARQLVSNHLSASAGGVESVADAISPLITGAVESSSIVLPTSRLPLATLAERKAKFHFIVTLDESAQAAIKAAGATLEQLGQPKVIHQPFARPNDATSAEETKKALQTFVEELPELLSFYA